jgi:thiamine biosynthesis lipoprotein
MTMPPVQTLRFAHDAMACTFGFALHGDDRAYLVQAARAAAAEIDRLEALLSKFQPDSDIARINTATPDDPVHISPDTLACLQLADTLYSQTGGAFDIAFAGNAPPAHTPHLVCDAAQLAVTTTHPGVTLDLGGLGKGYALDRACDLLAEWQVPAARLDAGQSTVRSLGPSPDDHAWQVAIRDPAQTDRALGNVRLNGRALSGSGQVLHDHHIRDPRNNTAAERWSATWALAPSAAEADALSTALMLLTSQEATQLCRAAPARSAILLSPHGAPQSIALAAKDWHPCDE